MRLVRFLNADEPVRLGVILADESVLDVRATASGLGLSVDDLGEMAELITAGPDALERVRTCVAASPDRQVIAHDARLVSPLPNPRALRLCTANTGHFVRARAAATAFMRTELGLDVPPPADEPPPIFFKAPQFYRGNHKQIGGPDDPILWPEYARFLDYELEIAAIIGQGGRDLDGASASAAIFGFTILNDVSARLPQLEEMALGVGPCKSKGFDGALKIGPSIVTADAFDPAGAAARIRINGEIVSRGHTGGNAFSWPEIVSFAAQGETLEPAEIISGGCIESGCGLETGRWVQPGDRLELGVDGIGTLSNTIFSPGVAG